MKKVLVISLMALALSDGCTVSYGVSASAYVRPTAGLRLASA